MAIPYVLAILAGIANAVEPGQNATLARALGHPLLAGLVCFAVGLLPFALALGLRQAPVPALRDAPWWAWTGGVLGAVVVLAQLTASEPIGAATFLGIVVTAGVAGSILLDHHGLVGFERRRASRLRVLGGALMVAGVALVAMF